MQHSFMGGGRSIRATPAKGGPRARKRSPATGSIALWTIAKKGSALACFTPNGLGYIKRLGRNAIGQPLAEAGFSSPKSFMMI